MRLFILARKRNSHILPLLELLSRRIGTIVYFPDGLLSSALILISVRQFLLFISYFSSKMHRTDFISWIKPWVISKCSFWREIVFLDEISNYHYTLSACIIKSTNWTLYVVLPNVSCLIFCVGLFADNTVEYDSHASELLKLWFY